MGRLVTVLVWLAVAALLVLALVAFLEPPGGDPATRAMRPVLVGFPLAAAALLAILNRVRRPWARGAALAVLLFPLALIALDSGWQATWDWLSSQPLGHEPDGTPWFEDPSRQSLAIACFTGDTGKVATLLAEGGAALRAAENGTTVLDFMVTATAFATDAPEGKLACVRQLHEAGVPLTREGRTGPVIAQAAFSGNAALTALLLAWGEDANALSATGRPILYDAIISHRAPNETVAALLAAGADPESRYTDSDGITTSALVHAARSGRWAICRQLLAKGADAGFTASDGASLAGYIRETEAHFQGNDSATREDLAAVKAAAGL